MDNDTTNTQAEPHSHSIRSLADFLKSPNRTHITILGLLFVVIAGLIIAIAIIPQAGNNNQPTEDKTLSENINEIMDEANAITNSDGKIEYFENLYVHAKTNEDKNFISLTCIEIMFYSSEKSRILDCLEKFSFDKNASSEYDLYRYYSFLRFFYLQNDLEKYAEIKKESDYLFQ